MENAQAERLAMTTTSAQETAAAPPAPSRQAGLALEVQPLLLTLALRSVAMEEDLALYPHTAMTETMYLEMDAVAHE